MIGLDGDAEEASGHFAFGLQFGNQGFDRIYRNGKTDALPLGDDGGINADDFTFHIQERSAGVAGIDGGIGLDKIVIRSGPDDPAFGTDDAGGDGAIQAEGIADGHDPVPDFQIIGISQGGSRKGFLGVNLDHRDIRLRIGTDNAAFIFFLVRQSNNDFLGAVHDMIVGEDIAVLTDNDS